MRIRGTLLLGFGIYTALALGLGIFAYVELRAITSRLATLETADDLTNTVLEVRRDEKNFLLFADEQNARSLERHLADLRAGIARIAGGASPGIAPATIAALEAAVREYEAAFAGLTAARRGLPGAEGDALERLRTTARDVQALADDLSRQARTAVETLLGRARRSVRLLLLAVAGAIVVGVAVNVRLFRSIAAPIARLEELTQRIAAGDLSGRIALRGAGEFLGLAESFNRMQDRLHDTMTTLELANEDLRSKRVQLVEAEKLATLGRFSAGVAHEVNNPLAIINEKAGLMRDLLARTPDVADRQRFGPLVDAIAEAVARCSATTHRILDFAGAGAAPAEAVDVNALLGELLKSFERQLLAKHILLASDLREGLPAIRTGRSRVRQVLTDLVRNRLDAAPPGAIVRVSTGMKDARTLQVAIGDNGPGMPPEALSRLFEPFSGAGEIGRDPGLGLWVSRGVMRNLGGEILAEGAPGRGTVFTVEIPVDAPPAPARPPA